MELNKISFDHIPSFLIGNKSFESFQQNHQKVPVLEFPNRIDSSSKILSVRLLAYNHSKYISECIEAILNQETNYDYEIVIAEDASTDGTREICIKYAEQYPDRIRLLLNDRKNNMSIYGKPSGLFNSIYSNFMINSKYVAMCEGDDLWCDPLKIQKSVDYLENHFDTVLCFGNSLLYNTTKPETQLERMVHFNECRTLTSEEVLNTLFQTSNIIYRNGLIDKYDPRALNILSGDLLLKVKMSQKGKIYFISDIKPSIYRVHQFGSYGPLGKIKKLQIDISAYKYLISYISEENTMTNALKNNLAWSYLRIIVLTLFQQKRIFRSDIKGFYRTLFAAGPQFLFFLVRRVIQLLKKFYQ